MTHAELHKAVRELAGGKYFTVRVDSSEHHPSRVRVLYEVYISDHDWFRSADPSTLLSLVKEALGDKPADIESAELTAIGEAPSSDDASFDLPAAG